jgi:hypothetical protein
MSDAQGLDLPMSDEAIREGSGKTWNEWVAVLDEWDASSKSHTEIARYIAGLGVDGWWAQGVTVGYERIKGLRQAGQQRDGSFQGSASKTVPVSIDRLFEAFVNDEARDAWLEPGTLTLRTAQPGKSARFDSDEGIVAMWFTDKGGNKSSVQLQVEKLPSKEAVDDFKALWKARLTDLAKWLQHPADS